MKTYFWKILYGMIIISFIFTACSKLSDNRNSINTDFYSDVKLNRTDIAKTEALTKPESNSKAIPTARDSKLVKSVTLDIETKQFEKTIKALDQSISKSNGYVESNHITGTSILYKNEVNSNLNSSKRVAQYSIRIPESNLDSYLIKMSKIGNVISKTISTEDISNQYFDTKMRIKSLNIQEERLLQLVKKSGTLKDIIELEKELSNVRYEIESLTSTLKQYDSLVNYSTINLSIMEVATMTDLTPPKTVPERITAQFIENTKSISNGLKNATVFMIGNSLLILIWIMILVTCYFITRKVLKKIKAEY